MTRVVFAEALQRHVACPPVEVDGATVRDVLEAAFALRPGVRGYVLDDQQALRKHMIVFVGGVMARDRTRLTDPVPAGAEVYVLQSLSGG